MQVVEVSLYPSEAALLFETAEAEPGKVVEKGFRHQVLQTGLTPK